MFDPRAENAEVETVAKDRLKCDSFFPSFMPECFCAAPKSCDFYLPAREKRVFLGHAPISASSIDFFAFGTPFSGGFFSTGYLKDRNFANARIEWWV